ncbi:MAG: hypothetical protein ABSE36_04550 [Terracidiphilus sp.]|jgi:hypothetical protein
MHGNSLSAFFATPLGVACYAIFFVAVWYAALSLIGILSGWHALSRRFKQETGPYGEIGTVGPFFYSIYMRFWCHYSSVIRLIAASDGLYASVSFPFRIGHPPLRIPWVEIQMRKTMFLWRRLVLLTLGNEEQIPMRISERMTRNLGILDRASA